MNSQSQRKEKIKSEEYLEFEKTSEIRHEYLDGEIFAMLGSSMNLGRELGVQLKNSPCRPFITDLRVKVQEIDKYTYPDIVVVCGNIDRQLPLLNQRFRSGL